MARAAGQDRPHEEQVAMLSRRFHEVHERMFKRQHRAEERRDWDDMPESYRRRVRFTFDTLLRGGYVTPGPAIGWEHDQEDFT